jgi:hypothetical protein
MMAVTSEFWNCQLALSSEQVSELLAALKLDQAEGLAAATSDGILPPVRCKNAERVARQIAVIAARMHGGVCPPDRWTWSVDMASGIPSILSWRTP